MKKLSFGFWFRSGKFGLNECSKCEKILLGLGIEFERTNYQIAFKEIFEESSLKNARKKEIMDIMWNSKITRYVVFDSEK
jgi:hypothetical protein